MTKHTLQDALRLELAGTIGLLTDEHDFQTMCRYRSFAFDDYATYMQGIEELLRTRASQGIHTTVALFDPEDYSDFCKETGVDPDVPYSRTQFTAEVTETGPTIRYEGQPLSDLVTDLIDEAVRQVTWEYASTLLARIGDCVVCGEDIGRGAFARASNLLSGILDAAQPGQRHLVCSVSASPETLLAVLHADTGSDGSARLDETEEVEFTTILALGLATQSSGGLVMRTAATNTADWLCSRERTADIHHFGRQMSNCRIERPEAEVPPAAIRQLPPSARRRRPLAGGWATGVSRSCSSSPTVIRTWVLDVVEVFVSFDQYELPTSTSQPVSAVRKIRRP
jgi:hypothetical protein